MQQEEKIFADGFSFKRNENAPDFVVGRLSLKAEDAIAFIREHEKNGWVNLNVKTARSGNYYIELDTYEPRTEGLAKTKGDLKPKSVTKKTANVENNADNDELPF
jgi:hypothetical protein